MYNLSYHNHNMEQPSLLPRPGHLEAGAAGNQQEKRSLLAWAEGGGHEVIHTGHSLHREDHKAGPVEAGGLLAEVLRRVLVSSGDCQDVEPNLVLLGPLELDVQLARRVELQLVASSSLCLQLVLIRSAAARHPTPSRPARRRRVC